MHPVGKIQDNCKRHDFGMDKLLMMELEHKLVCIMYSRVVLDVPMVG